MNVNDRLGAEGDLCLRIIPMTARPMIRQDGSSALCSALHKAEELPTQQSGSAGINKL